MKHLLNVLAGVGSVMDIFGASPQYDYPKRGDRARDMRLVGGDIRKAVSNLRKPTQAALPGKYGQIDNRARKGT